MKIMLACLLTLSSWAHAQSDADDDLVRALQNLNSRGLYVDQSKIPVIQDRAYKVVVVASLLGSAMAAANSRLFAYWRKTTKTTELVIADGALVAILAGGAAYFGAELWKRFERPPNPLPASQYVASPEAMNEFFRLPLDTQVSIAKQDEGLRKFLMTLSRAYDFTDKRVPDEPTPVAEAPAPTAE